MGMLRGFITLSLIVSFLAVVFWAMRGVNKHRFEAAALIPLEEDAHGPEHRR